MLAGILGSFQALLAQPTALAIGAGLLAGALAGTTLVVTGTLPERPATQLTLLECPDAGREVARVAAGTSMLITARNADGTWLELYVGVPGIERGWAPAAMLRVETAIDSLPIAPCAVAPPGTLAPATGTPTAAASASPAPSAIATVLATASPGSSAGPTPTPRPSTTAKPGASPTPTPLPPPPTIPPPSPTPTPAPDTTPPAITGIGITLATQFNNVYYLDNAGNNCGASTQAKITATITDSGGSGLNGLQIRLRFYSPNGGYYDLPMGHQIGTSFWNATINNDLSWVSGQFVYWIYAADNAGNSTSSPSSPPAGAPLLAKGYPCIL